MLKDINIALPQEILNIISLQSEEVTYKLKELVILELYREHKISAGKAAEILGISKEMFIHFSSEKGIAHINQSENEVYEDYKNIENCINGNNL